MDSLLRTLFALTEVDPFLVAQACEAILISGSPGSGKSSTAMKQIIMAYLRAGFGGIFLSAKSEDTRNATQYIKDAGREEPIIFGPQSGHCFDLVHYLWNRPGRGAAMLETLVDYFGVLMAIGGEQVGKSREPFWERKVQQTLRAAVVLLHLAGKPISIKTIDELISDFPTAPGQHETPEWQSGDSDDPQIKGVAVLSEIRARREGLSAQEFSDLTRALHFMLVEWPALDERVRTSIHAEWSGLADKFLYEPFSSLLSSGRCTFLPEDITQANRIVIVDWPMLEGGDTFRMVTCMIKLAFQFGMIQRDVEKHPTPSFLVADECQLTILPKGRDERFLQVARSARVCSLLATQNYAQLAAEFGEHEIAAKTKGWLANIGTRIAMQQTDPGTNENNADVIGKVWKPIQNTSVGPNHASVGEQMQLTLRILPTEFSTLKKASPGDPFAEAVVYSGGRIFEATGQPFVITRFSRDKERP